MIQVNIKIQLVCDKNKLWNIITNNSYFTWRTDLLKIETLDENHFVEYAKNGYPTYFEITSKEYLKKYSFQLENTNIKGNWIGLFHELENGTIELDFTEEVEVKNPIMKLVAKPYLKKQQERYITDLKRELIQNK